MPKLTAMMLMRNEAGRYLKKVLSELSEYVDEAIILDDCSTDNTVSLCKEFAFVKKIIEKTTPSFWYNEYALRIELWETTLERKPEWILAIDSDEIFEERVKRELPSILKRNFSWISTWLYDMWGSMDQYRIDGRWYPKQVVRLLRYNPDFKYLWRKTPLHCGSLPFNYRESGRGAKTSWRIKHFGWAGPKEERQEKYLRYISRDGEGIYGNLEQYESILTEPVLQPWVEGKRPSWWMKVKHHYVI